MRTVDPGLATADVQGPTVAGGEVVTADSL
jgi:hypothetical protein